ncbi:Undecaprenyl-phosphate mannosyltransferase [Grimontia celer]|uniref:Undecaprenyl-phosphate mannosyltransferase n=2 Tax=Grimontia celer TaxID=1796497 RepID=A0A128FE38_9GAMM|nr:Undecaprenyl-phosphate mannosyltransferase [Grimontia celer]
MKKICIVMPSYKSRDKISCVIDKIPDYVSRIFIVDDKCPQETGAFVSENYKDKRIKVIFNSKNLGVGGATIRGYEEAINEGMDIVVKIDSDGQMDPDEIEILINPILLGKADYTKGNRFYLVSDSASMPIVRRIGNLGLSFITKISTGYWNIFDPTNGFTAIHKSALSKLNLKRISSRFFFESDMLFNLKLIHAVVIDVPMKAIYGDEKSNLSIRNSLGVFFVKNIRNAVKRIVYQYFLHDFNPGSISLILAAIFSIFSFFFGGYNFYQSVVNGTLSSSGTVMLSALPLFFSVQFIVSFFNYDYTSIPKIPLQILLGDR